MSPIGVFDSGYGGLTVLKEIVKQLPQYDYLYLGDNARAPYGTRSFETVYKYTLECVKWLIDQGCPLIILACNTASAKALRSIQQNDLEKINPDVRVLGVIRPTAEVIGNFSTSKHIGILATKGTVDSRSYIIEIEKFFPEVQVTQEACPMWVPLVENNEQESDGADYFIKKHIDNILIKEPEIDTLLLGCTHYPLLEGRIRYYLPQEIKILSQGSVVAESLKKYLACHPEIETKISKNQLQIFHTTEAPKDFNEKAALFFGERISSSLINF
ncbi:MAG: glutamate racemase [Chitinophagaceae bacterium]